MRGSWRRLVLFAFLAAGVAGSSRTLIACSSQSLKGIPDGASSDPDEFDPENPPVDGGRPADPGAPPVPATSNVTIQVQPSDQGQAVIAAIQAAQTSVHMTMYLLSDDAVINALIARKNAGKDVKVVLNQNFPSGGGSNQAVYTQLLNAGVDVKWAPAAYPFTHAKAIIIDGNKLLLMTMNLTYSSPRTNREYIATDTDPADIDDAEAIFQADYSNQNAFVKGKLVVSPSMSSPTDARKRIEALINSATTNLDVECQSLADDTIVNAIVKAHEEGVAVRVVLNGDFGGSAAQADAVALMKSKGVPLRELATPDIHAKAIVVDNARAFVGSQNMTRTALMMNREIGVVTDAKAEVTKVRDVIASDFQKGSPIP